MKQRSSVSIGLRDASQGVLQAKSAEGCSARTIGTYSQHLEVWLAHMGEVAVDKVTAQEVRAFLAWLRTGYKPRRFGGNTAPLAPKTLRNIWISLAAFFRWASSDFNFESP